MPLSAGAAKTLRALRAAARERLSQADIQNAAQEADWLLCHASGLSAAALLAHQDSPLDEKLTSAMMTPAMMTPAVTASTVSLKSISRTLTTSIPVHAPVPGSLSFFCPFQMLVHLK